MFSPEYLAGFFDGEGSLGLYSRGQNRYALTVTINQKDSAFARKILDHLKNEYGGRTAVYPMTNRSNQYRWYASGEVGTNFLRAIIDHLHLKKEQAEIAIEWWDSRPAPTRAANGQRMALPDEVHERDARYADLLKFLKK